MWFRDNLWHKVDWNWFKQGGGIVYKDKHPPAERMNGGEKAWYWLLLLAGVLVVTSGLIMDFPIFGQDRWAMQSSQMIHATLAIALIAMFFGHVYIGTIGMEGSFESMTRGTVDYNWAKQHHRIWYERKLRGEAPEDDREMQADPISEQQQQQQQRMAHGAGDD
jgi:formate dehydrogenase subunit gamma